ncbi:outer membrane lipoprotein [Derxia lacustris]|uniref:glycine zipper 2TM domain-containing protein n=1 Tax=Derxia lacustris TaxID=764842 RepID=UPI000A1743F9|nr:glycine zipper 2TM domain-containing protein [Derxia lacustris]
MESHQANRNAPKLASRGRGLVAAVVVTALSAGLLGGCAAPRTSASVYDANTVGREQTVRMGTLESVRPVTIDKGQTGIGTAGGAVVGGIAGSSVGGGKGSVLAAIGGAIVGGLAGQAIEGKGSAQNGLELTVKLDNGDLRVIVQAADESFAPGDRVRLLSGAGGTRVTH